MGQLKNEPFLPNKISVFEAGNVKVQTIKVKKCCDENGNAPPADLLVLSPKAEGNYPVMLFCHGYCTNNTWYSQFLQHVSSHGYIVVAPQFYHYLFISLHNEVKTTAKVTNWIPNGLALSLPKNVKPSLSELALMGHSRGGKTAFALALGHEPTSLKFKALLGLDPVSTPSPPTWVDPQILSFVPHSFQLSIPVGIVGTGLSSHRRGCIIPPPAPDGFNHSEFFNESKPPCCYFRARDYGHWDVLDDSKSGVAGLVCRSGKGCREKMRRGVAGVVVAFLKAYLRGEFGDLENIVAGKDIAPIVLDPIIHVKEE